MSGGKFREDSRFSSKWTHQNDPPGTPRAAVKWQRAARTVLDARATNPSRTPGTVLDPGPVLSGEAHRLSKSLSKYTPPKTGPARTPPAPRRRPPTRSPPKPIESSRTLPCSTPARRAASPRATHGPLSFGGAGPGSRWRFAALVKVEAGARPRTRPRPCRWQTSQNHKSNKCYISWPPWGGVARIPPTEPTPPHFD